MKRFLAIIVVLAAAMIITCIPASAKGYYYDEEDHEHQWGKWKVIEEPGCFSKGYEERECSVCYKTEWRDIPAYGKHNWGEWEVIEEPDCFSKGYEERECLVCYEKEKRDIPAYGKHNWSDWSFPEDWDEYDIDSCTKPVKKERECRVCGKEETKKFPALGHKWGRWHITRNATPYHTGKKYRFCCRYNCDKTEDAIIPKTKATKREKAAIKTVKRFFVAAKTHNNPKMRKCFAKCSSTYFSSKGSLLAKWSKKHNKKTMKCVIKDVWESGYDEITVKAKVTYASGYSTFYSAWEKWYFWATDHKNASYKASRNKFISIMKKDFKRKGTKKTSKTIKIKCKCTSKGWKIKSSKSNLRNIAELDYYKATDVFKEDYELY